MSAGLQRAFSFAPVAPATEVAHRRNLVIEAGAGTGKTTAIVGRVLELLLGADNIAPERIVLMTFTEKAAGEIADRIHGALAEIESQLDGGEAAIWPVNSANPLFRVPAEMIDDYRRACALQLSRVDAIRSQTIHSFCQSLLRANAIEAGLDPLFKIVEGFERSLLLGRLYDAWVDEETRSHPTPQSLAEWELLLDHFGYLFMIREQIFDLVARRDLLSEDVEFGDMTLVEPQLAYAIGKVRLTDTNAVDDESAAAIFRYVKSVEPPHNGTIDEWIAYFAPVAKATREANLPRNAVLKEALKIFRADTGKGKSIYDRLVAHRSAVALHALTRRFLLFLDREKRLLGVVDFDDLLLRTVELLEDAEVLQRLRAQFDVMFVDEFQDTDRTQARIIERLAKDTAGNWVPGKLVLVGDPKQSIYGFRRADPEMYRIVTQALIDAGAEREVLEEQYRSDAPLVDAVNVMFASVFGMGDDDPNVFRPPYRALKSAKAKIDRDLDARMTFLRAEESPDKYMAEAEAIARFIRENREGGERDLQRFAILFRRLTQIDDYLEVFDREGIEYVLPSTKDFLERRAPVDLLAVLRAIAFPFDRGAELSAARTPYFALSDDEIAEGMVSEEPVEPWASFQTALLSYRENAAHCTVSETIDLLVSSARIEDVYDSLADAKRARRHLERVRAIAFEYDQKIGGSLRQFVTEIDRRRKEPDEVEPSLADDDSNAVRILSVHAAKGLEFETVILPDLMFKSPGRDSTQLLAVEEPRTVVMLGRAQSLAAHYRTIGNQPLSSVHNEREKAELRRLFYVAVTRAKSDVVFVCNGSFSRNGFMSCVAETFELDKDSYAKLFEGDAIQELKGITIAVREGQAMVSAKPLSAPQNLLATGPLAPVDIAAPAPPKTLSDAARVRAGSKNRAQGILLHRLLEVWDGTSDVAPLIERLAAEAAADTETVAKLRARVGTLRKSPAFRRIAAARTAGRELSVRFVDESGAVIERRIDRLLIENGREVVVDYKSGAPADSRLAGDREQVRRYCEAIGRMTGRECGGLLWYIDSDSDALVEV